jgi:hypothetical protein
MKPKNVYRGLSSMPMPDQQQNTPVMGIGRVSRIHRTYKKDKKRSRHRHRSKAQFLMRYLHVILTLAALVFVGGIVWILYQQVNKKEPTVASVEETTKALAIFTITPRECVALVEKWLKLNEVDQLAAHSRLVHLGPDEALAEMTKTREQQGTVKRIKWLGTDQSISIPQEKVLVSYESGHYRIASLIANAEGKWQVDLESFVAYQSKPWKKIMGQEACQARVRVLLRHDSYYNGAFQDESVWASYALTNTEQSDVIYGYARKSSAAYLALEDVLSAKPNVPVILEIAREAEMLPSQYEIKKVMERGWVESQKELSRSYERRPQSKTREPR